MARNVTIQVLRGIQANIQSAMPLSLGEMYFATDTGNLFFGTPGTSIGYIQVGDMSQVSEKLDTLLITMEAIRRALVAIACEGGRNNPQDFDLAAIAQELPQTDSVLS